MQEKLVTDEEEAKLEGIHYENFYRDEPRGITKFAAEVEVHHKRGVLYVHVADSEVMRELGVMTYFRVHGLAKPIPMDKGFSLDVHVMQTEEVDYREKGNGAEKGRAEKKGTSVG